MPVDERKVLAFLTLAFALSWTTALFLFVSPIEYGTVGATVVVTIGYMWAPALAAIVVQRRWNDPIRSGTGLFVGRKRWLVVSWVAPLALLGATIAFGVAHPAVSFTTDYGVFLADMGFSPEQIEASVSALESFPGPPALLLLGQGLVFGATINAAAALGEELGWRGLLLNELAPLGFWRLSVVTGAIWGVWHAPLILQGHNFPSTPVAGVAVMTLWTIAAAPIFTYLAVRAGSVLAPTLFHGTFNAVASLSLIYLAGAENLWVGPVGVAGIGAAIVGTGVCVLHDRYGPGRSITTGSVVAFQ